MNNLHTLERKVKSENNCLRNHLLSILKDSQVPELIHQLLPKIKLFANLRNGLWYSNNFSGTCYFKSTDGHDGNWNFSLNRLNLDVAKAASKNGVIIVDSTRRGKRFPDSMKATIPIWCAVINSILFQISSFNPPPWMPLSQISLIKAKIEDFILKLPASIRILILQELSSIVLKPFIPIWCCPGEDGMIDWSGDYAEQVVGIDEESTSKELNFLPVILLSCSDSTLTDAVHSEEHSWSYIPGAGDDDENWAMGLTSRLFWANRDLILSSSPNSHDVDTIVLQLLSRRPESELCWRIGRVKTVLPNVFAASYTGLPADADLIAAAAESLLAVSSSPPPPRGQLIVVVDQPAWSCTVSQHDQVKVIRLTCSLDKKHQQQVGDRLCSQFFPLLLTSSCSENSCYILFDELSSSSEFVSVLTAASLLLTPAQRAAGPYCASKQEVTAAVAAASAAMGSLQHCKRGMKILKTFFASR